LRNPHHHKDGERTRSTRESTKRPACRANDAENAEYATWRCADGRSPSAAATMNRMIAPHTAADPSRPLAVLISGGLDSAILLAEALERHPAVWPLYIRFGLFWEKAEVHHLRRFLEAVGVPALRSLRILEMPVADLYGEHWSLNGEDVPAAG